MIPLGFASEWSYALLYSQISIYRNNALSQAYIRLMIPSQTRARLRSPVLAGDIRQIDSRVTTMRTLMLMSI